MTYIKKYNTPNGLSNIIMSSDDGIYLTGLWFENSKDQFKHSGDLKEKELPIFDETCKWL